MDEQSKKLYDRLVKAEWVENVKDTPSQEQAGVQEHELIWVKNSDPMEHGLFKIIMFYKLYNELQKGGAISPDELNYIVGMGRGFAIQKGLENI